MLPEGNNAKLNGSIIWINVNGTITELSECPRDRPKTILVNITPGFIQVGTPGIDNSAISVTIRNLHIFEFSRITDIQNGASVTIEGSKFERIIDGWRGCKTPAIYAGPNANLSIRNSEFDTIINSGDIFAGLVFNGAITGYLANDLGQSEWQTTFHTAAKELVHSNMRD